MLTTRRLCGAAKIARQSSGSVLTTDRVDPAFAARIKAMQFAVTTKDGLESVADFDGYDVLAVSGEERVDGDALAGRRLKVVTCVGGKGDNIAVGEATRRGVLVQYSGDRDAIGHGEETMALVLASSRHVLASSRALKGGAWTKDDFVGAELRNKVLGLLGVDGAARRTAGLALALGMRVVAFDPTLTRESAAALGITKAGTRAELLAAAHVLSLHSPLTKATRGLVGPAVLGQMRPGAVVVSATHAELVCPDAVREALDSGALAAAAFGVRCAGVGPEWEALSRHPRALCLHAPQTAAAGTGSAASTAAAAASASVEAVAVAERAAVARAAAEAAAAAVAGSGIGRAHNASHLALLHARDSQPLAQVAEALGSVHGQLLSTPPRGVKFTVHGPVFKSFEMREMLVAIATRELLGHVAAASARCRKLAAQIGRVNLVNAKEAARHMDIPVSVDVAPQAGQVYENMITMELTWEDGAPVPRASVSGAVLAGEPHIVAIDNGKSFPAFRPRTNVVIIRNTDKPGVLHHILGPLTRAHINIARIGVAREGIGAEALCIIICDDPVPASVIDELRGQDGLKSAAAVEFGSLYRGWGRPRDPFACSVASTAKGAGVQRRLLGEREAGQD